MGETSKYYNSLLPLYLFILIFFIILTSNLKKGNSEQAIINNVRKTFNKDVTSKNIVDHNNEDFQYPTFIEAIELARLPDLQNAEEFTYNIEKNILKNNSYSWSIDKNELFLPNSFFFKNNSNSVISDIIHLAYIYEKSYRLLISWPKNMDSLDKERFKHLINMLYENISFKNYLVNLNQKNQDKIVISLIARE